MTAARMPLRGGAGSTGRSGVSSVLVSQVQAGARGQDVSGVLAGRNRAIVAGPAMAGMVREV